MQGAQNMDKTILAFCTDVNVTSKIVFAPQPKYLNTNLTCQRLQKNYLEHCLKRFFSFICAFIYILNLSFCMTAE